MDVIQKNRIFLQCPDLKAGGFDSDQMKGLPQPPVHKPAASELIELPPFSSALTTASYADLLDNRRSERIYSDKAASQEQLAFILWSAQGIQGFRGENRYASLRPVPSGGARHPFELYIAVLNVDGLKPGLYHYLPLEHIGEKRVSIEYLNPIEDAPVTLTEMAAGQEWATKAAFILFFSCIPYRAEWRYNHAAHRVVLIDLGHVGQNVMLSAVACGLGSCCLAAFDTAKCNEVLGLCGDDEFTVYAIPVGTLK